MITSPYEKYRQSSVQTSTPEQLVIMLYDGAIRFVRAGLAGLDNSNYETVNLNLGKAQTIISELMSTLDHSIEISKNLFALYEYMNHLLITANIQKSKEPAEEAIGYLTELRQTWLQASKLASHPNPTPGEASHG